MRAAMSGFIQVRVARKLQTCEKFLAPKPRVRLFCAAFFAHHGVTCASDYKKRVAALSSSEPTPPSLPAGWISLTPTSSVRYFGQVEGDLPHGLGVQLAQTPQRRVLYCGEFAGGQREGLGLMLGARGERYSGRWQGDEIWGLGEYCFAADGAGGKGAEQTPVSFRGMFAGRPAGPGMMEWSGGEQVRAACGEVPARREVRWLD